MFKTSIETTDYERVGSLPRKRDFTDHAGHLLQPAIDSSPLMAECVYDFSERRKSVIKK